MAELTRADLERLYLPPSDDFTTVDVPELPFFMIDGQGPPGVGAHLEAIRWLFLAVAPIKRIARERLGPRFVEPPLEGLWWADDMADLETGRKDNLRWCMMIPAPGWADAALLADAVDEVAARHGDPPVGLRLDRLHEGPCVQIMHVGPFDRDAPALARRLHEEWLPAHGLRPHGAHHEIYLSDPGKTAPERRRTVMRQPVCPA